MDEIIPANDFVTVRPLEVPVVQFRSGLSGNTFATAELERRMEGAGVVVNNGACESIKIGDSVLFWNTKTTKVTYEGQELLLIDSADIFCRR